MPIVSVVIPTYNRAGEILRCINSVLQQTFKCFELIIVDDGSQDDTRKVVAAIKDDRIRYIYKENGGVSSARNYGLDASGCEFVAFLDSDDEWEPQFLELCHKALINNPCVTVAYGRDKVVEKNKKVCRTRDSKMCKNGRVFAELFESFFALVPCSMIRRSDLDGLRFNESMKNMEDVDFFLRLSSKKQFMFVPDAFLLRHDTEGSLSKSGADFDRLSYFESLYEEKKADGLISRHRAHRKLAKLARSAGKKCERKKNMKEAAQYYKRGLTYNPLDLRCFFRLFKLWKIKT